jgi:hypothetical protein
MTAEESQTYLRDSESCGLVVLVVEVMCGRGFVRETTGEADLFGEWVK